MSVISHITSQIPGCLRNELEWVSVAMICELKRIAIKWFCGKLAGGFNKGQICVSALLLCDSDSVILLCLRTRWKEPWTFAHNYWETAGTWSSLFPRIWVNSADPPEDKSAEAAHHWRIVVPFLGWKKILQRFRLRFSLWQIYTWYCQRSLIFTEFNNVLDLYF